MNKNPTEAEQKQMDAELKKYVDDVYNYEDTKKLDDVYVTDH